MGVCDEEVTNVLCECGEINDLCINRIDGSESECEALHCHHHGHPLREDDEEIVFISTNRPPDKINNNNIITISPQSGNSGCLKT